MEAAPSFLSSLGPDDRRALEEVTTRRRFQRNSILYHWGEDPAGVLVIESGRVKITAPAEFERETILAFRGPGDLIGEVGAFDGRPRSASVVALEPVVALACAGSDFRRLIDRRPSVEQALMTILIERLREADTERADFGARDVLGRVAHRTLELADRFGAPCDRGVDIRLPITQDELAGWSGASREAVSKALGTMRELGWIETGRRSLVVRDEAALRDYLHSGTPA